MWKVQILNFKKFQKIQIFKIDIFSKAHSELSDLWRLYLVEFFIFHIQRTYFKLFESRSNFTFKTSNWKSSWIRVSVSIIEQISQNVFCEKC